LQPFRTTKKERKEIVTAVTIQPHTDIRLAICIQNTDYPASLEVRKLYQVLSDNNATAHNLLRVIDESGEDYLYPAEYFLLVELPQPVREAVLQAA
jgi:hypothetical protein